MVPTSDQTTDVVVQTHGDVNRWEREYARDKIDRLRSMAGAPVLFARVDLRIFTDPARERPADAKASLDVNGSLVRAHVAAATITEAVDLLDARLRERLARLHGRNEARVHTGARHASAAALRPTFGSVAAEDREVVAHKSFAVGEQTVDEAIGDLELLDHDFFLFRNAATGEDNVVARDDDGYVLFEPRIRAMAGLGKVDTDWTSTGISDQINHHCDVLVVGAGPAGLAAARLAAEAGLSVTLVDDQRTPGGSLGHRTGEVGPFPLTTFAEVKKKAETIATALGDHPFGLLDRDPAGESML